MRRPYESAIHLAKALGDDHRGDIVRLLAADSFNAGELAYALDLAQPALSHHLKRLVDVGVIERRREGNTIYYARAFVSPDDLLAAFFCALDQHVLPTPLAKRLTTIHCRRAEKSRAFFLDNGHRFTDQHDLIASPTVYVPLAARVLAQTARTEPFMHFNRALDIGPGDGDFLTVLAETADAVVAIDEAKTMLERARERAHGEGLDRIQFLPDDLASHAASSERAYDLVIASMVLHHAPSPAQFLRDCARLLSPDACLLIVELCNHEQDWVGDACGDLWHGFAPNELDHWARAVDLAPALERYVTLNNGFRLQIKTYLKESK